MSEVGEEPKEEKKEVSPTIDTFPWTFKCVTVARDEMGKYNFPNEDNGIIEVDCRTQLKGTWPITPNLSGKHLELMKMIASDADFQEKMQRVKHYIKLVESGVDDDGSP
eukprot:8928041-Karenia_brevis.AAC.1